MSNFRIQKEKKIKNDIVISTLDKKHKEKTEYFKNLNQNKSDISDEINKINEEINEINMKFYLEQKDIDKKKELNNKKETLEEKLLEYNNSEINYYDNVGDLITKYYEENTSENDIVRSKNILELFNVSKNTEKKGKIDIYEKFCNRVDGLRLEKDDGSNRIKYCLNCKIEKFLDVGKSSYICPECGEMEKVLIDEDNTIKEYSCYKRLSHFKEWLTQIQAKESPDIDDETFEIIVKEINKQKIINLEDISKDISRDKMQKILFKLGKSHLYEHIPYIINKLCGKPPPKISPDIENKFYQMFMQIQEPWEIYKPEGRKNIIQYSYIIYKFCELLELDELLSYFPLLKSPKKLMEHDKIWKKFCDYLKWDFYPTEI
jgi:predicted RNA-binding Zn-ribbon protein involved in translation (DUF1610 family)